MWREAEVRVGRLLLRRRADDGVKEEEEGKMMTRALRSRWGLSKRSMVELRTSLCGGDWSGCEVIECVKRGGREGGRRAVG